MARCGFSASRSINTSKAWLWARTASARAAVVSLVELISWHEHARQCRVSAGEDMTTGLRSTVKIGGVSV